MLSFGHFCEKTFIIKFCFELEIICFFLDNYLKKKKKLF
jgi:hypothetical protein